MADTMQPCSTTLKDAHPDHSGTLPICLSVSPNGMSLYAEGHGDCGSSEGHGTPIFIELYKGELRVLVWADINKEDPTHVVPLNGARNDRRQPDDDSNQ